MFQQVYTFCLGERERETPSQLGIPDRAIPNYWTKPRNQLQIRPINYTHYNVTVLYIKTL